MADNKVRIVVSKKRKKDFSPVIGDVGEIYERKQSQGKAAVEMRRRRQQQNTPNDAK